MRENFNQFNEQYNKQEINWRKSVSEISKFIIDRLDKNEFYDFLEGKEINKDKMIRWQVRLDELLDKITKRMGYHIDQNKLFTEAYYQIMEQNNSGELNYSKSLAYFCDNINNLIIKRNGFVNN